MWIVQTQEKRRAVIEGYSTHYMLGLDGCNARHLKAKSIRNAYMLRLATSSGLQDPIFCLSQLGDHDPSV